jgi:hypothetical protein
MNFHFPHFFYKTQLTINIGFFNFANMFRVRVQTFEADLFNVTSLCCAVYILSIPEMKPL